MQELEASDIVHDLLAFLAEEMLRLNKEKRAVQCAFLDWLVDTLKIQPQPDKDGKVGIVLLKHKANALKIRLTTRKSAAILWTDVQLALISELRSG